MQIYIYYYDNYVFMYVGLNVCACLSVYIIYGYCVMDIGTYNKCMDSACIGPYSFIAKLVFARVNICMHIWSHGYRWLLLVDRWLMVV